MAWPRKCKTYTCKNKSSYGFKWCEKCHSLRIKQKKVEPWIGFSNKTMRCIDPNKPHIQLISNWYRVSPMPKRCDLATRDKWLAAHGYIRKLNILRHFPQ